MGTEIERKFLVVGEGWRGLGEATLYRQGYLNSAKERTVRVRVAASEGFLTIKGRNVGAERPEFEYSIPLADAEQLLELCEGPLIEKWRTKAEVAGLVWEIDEFIGDNAGLIVAEVELEREDQVVVCPEWVGEEVTEDTRYYNSSLARRPYSKWENG